MKDKQFQKLIFSFIGINLCIYVLLKIRLFVLKNVFAYNIYYFYLNILFFLIVGAVLGNQIDVSHMKLTESKWLLLLPAMFPFLLWYISYNVKWIDRGDYYYLDYLLAGYYLIILIKLIKIKFQ